MLAVAFHGVPGLVAALGGGLIALILFGLPSLLGWIKLGDLKLAVACGLLLKFPLVLWGIAFTCLVGGALGLGYAAYRRQLGSVLGNLGRAAAGTFKRGTQPRLRELSELTLPYGVAIAIGSVWAVLSHYFPQVLIF